MSLNHKARPRLSWALAGLLVAPVLLCAARVVAQPVASSSEQEDPVARARLLDAEATGMFERGHHREALRRFRETFALLPNPTTAWNIGRCYEELKELGHARRAFQQLYLDAFTDLPPEKRQRAHERLAELERRLNAWKVLHQRGELALEHERPDEARTALEMAWEINHDPETQWALMRTLDRLGQTEALREAVALYEELSDLTEQERKRGRDLLDQHERRLTAGPALTPPAGRAPESAPLTEQDSISGLSVAGWTLMGVGGLTLLGGLSLRVSYQDEAEEIQTTKDPMRYDELLAELGAKEPIMGVLVGGGIALLVGGGILLWVGADDEPSAPRADVRLGITPWGVVVHGHIF